jgi:hypothetical protein
MNQPYPPGGGEPYDAGGGPSYPAEGQPPQLPSWQPDYPSYPADGGQQYAGGPSPYPPGWQTPGPSGWQTPTPSGPPQSIQRAVMLMYAGAGLEVLGLIFDLIIRRGSTASGIPGAIIGIGLWIWMAKANQAGKNWARITSTVFFGIDCLGLLLILVGVGVVMHAVSSSVKIILVASVLAAVVTWVIGLMTIVLLWRRESSEYYAAVKRG